MDKQFFGSVFLLANAQQIGLKILFLLLLVSLTNACELISSGSSPKIPNDNPGANVSLADEFADSVSDNSHRLLTATKEIQYCSADLTCAPRAVSYINYYYTDNLDPIENLLDVTQEYQVGYISNTLVSHRQYHYADTRLDKVSVRGNGNFHTLHDYHYDDEDDEDYTGITLERPKLRKEYICDINLNPVTAQTCGRTFADNTAIPPADDNTVYKASEVITYIYNADGYLYRKEFDVNNDTKIDHQKIYHYKHGVLVRVDTDNFYNGKIDERFEYERSEDLGLRTFIDNGYLTKNTRGTDIAVSYKNGVDTNYIATAGQTNFSYRFYIADSSEIQVTLNDIVLVETADYSVSNSLTAPYGGTISLTTPAALGDNIVLTAPDNGYDALITKECYFNRSSAKECTNRSTENFHWVFVWEKETVSSAGNCWAGGLDDIDPEARTIEYLCKQRD